MGRDENGLLRMAPQPPRDPPQSSQLAAAGGPARSPPEAWRDPLLLALGALLVVLAVPYVLPGLDPEAVYRFGEDIGLSVLLGVVLVGILQGTRALETRAERRFWNLLAAALGFVLLVRLLYVSPLTQGDRGHIVVDISYILFYFPFILALRRRSPGRCLNSLRLLPARGGAFRGERAAHPGLRQPP